MLQEMLLHLHTVIHHAGRVCLWARGALLTAVHSVEAPSTGEKLQGQNQSVCMHCLSIVSICSMYVFSLQEFCVFVFVPCWMGSLFSTLLCCVSAPEERVTAPIRAWPDPFLQQKHMHLDINASILFISLHADVQRTLNIFTNPPPSTHMLTQTHLISFSTQ